LETFLNINDTFQNKFFRKSFQNKFSNKKKKLLAIYVIVSGSSFPNKPFFYRMSYLSSSSFSKKVQWRTEVQQRWCSSNATMTKTTIVTMVAMALVVV